jgi:hypothetical protein
MLRITNQKTNLIRSRKVIFILLSLLICFALTACKKVNEENKTIFLEEEEKDPFNYTYVQRGDVDLTYEINCIYQQTKSENYCFPVKNRVVQAVNVTKGDIVKKGQVLAELDNENVEDKIRDSNYIIDKNNLLIEQAKQQQQLDLKDALDSYNLTAKSSTDTNDYNTKVSNINDSYSDKITDYQNAIVIEQLKLDSYNNLLKESKLCAGISGTVTFVKPNMTGTYSDPAEQVFTIIDNANCVYIGNDKKYISYFKKQKQVKLYVGSGEDTKTYLLEPTQVSTWKDRMLFAIKDENFTPGVGDSGTIYAVLGHKENVLFVDNKAMHKANGKNFVYVLDDKGNRIMKSVEIGLIGNTSTEIVSGLNEGDKIILNMESYWGE